jgi:hypothetical protein
VQVQRGIEGDPPRDGFLVGASSELLLLHMLQSRRLDLDGYEVLRIRGVRKLSAQFDERAFYLEALKLKDIGPARQPDVDLSDLPSAVLSAQAISPLLVIEREIVEPGAADVGRVIAASERGLMMRLISSQGRWIDGTVSLNTDEITRVAFGEEYEKALALFASHSETLPRRRKP